MKKRILSLVLILVMAIGFMPSLSIANAEKLGDLTYSIDNGEVTITDCDKNVTSVEIPETIGGYPVTSIGESAFNGCSSLSSITIPDSVTYIGCCAFQDCTSLVSITIPDSVISIDDWAFENCSSLTEVTIPNSVTFIGYAAFQDCSGLVSMTIPDSVTSIGTLVFNGCTSLTEVTIPDSVTSISSSTFNNCKSLTEVTIPDSVTSIGGFVFSGCSSLKKAVLSKQMSTISENTFVSSGIEIIYIPKEITLIKNGAFADTEVDFVYYGGSEADKQGLTIQANNDSLNNATWVYNATGLHECQYDNACDPTCNLCGDIRTITHSYGNYVSDGNATVDADGTKTRTCSVCGNKDTVADVGSKLPTPTPTPQPQPQPQPEPTPQPTPDPVPEIKDTASMFNDIKAGAWYKEYVDYAVTFGIFNGTTENTFAPSMTMTRAQFVQVLANISGVDTADKNATTVFTDVPSGKWFTPAVKWAFDNGIVGGTGDGKFSPNNNITREDMCVMLVRFAKYKNLEIKATKEKTVFADDSKIGKWAVDAVYTCQMAEIVGGKGNNMFDPKATGSRSEAATIFTRFHKNYIA